MSKPLIAYCISFYDDVQSLPRCLNSIFNHNTGTLPFKVIAIDGRYYGYPSKSYLSTDGSRELIQQSYPNTIVELYDFPNLPEWQKRQKYVDIVAKQHIPFLLIIDSDEWFEPRPKWEKLKQQLNYIMKYEPDNGNIYSIKCVDLDVDIFGNQYTGLRPRLWFKPEEVEYKEKHYMFHKRQGVDNKKPFRASKTIPSDIIQMFHNPTDSRTPKRLKKRLMYEKRLVSELEK